MSNSQYLEFSDRASDLLKGIETLRLTPYDDETGKATSSYCVGATIGYGHLIGASSWSKYAKGITEAQADELFAQDLQPFVNGVNNMIRVSLSQNQFDALVILAFNIGLTSFASSSLIKLINGVPGSHYATVQQAWMAFSYSRGVQVQGLINRRRAEYNIYSTGVYAAW